MLNSTQKQFVINQLNRQGYISRNQCLRNYISRLGAIICDLNKRGYNLIGEYRETDYGRDYIYKEKKQQEELF